MPVAPGESRRRRSSILALHSSTFVTMPVAPHSSEIRISKYGSRHKASAIPEAPGPFHPSGPPQRLKIRLPVASCSSVVGTSSLEPPTRGTRHISHTRRTPTTSRRSPAVSSTGATRCRKPTQLSHKPQTQTPTSRNFGFVAGAIPKEKVELLSKYSNFPTRDLPPPGLQAANLNGAGSIEYQIGDTVQVRHFRRAYKCWSDWQPGKVESRTTYRWLVGNYAKCYTVRTVCPETRLEILDRYIPFLGEIWSIRSSPPIFTAEQCTKQLDQANYVYARMPCASRKLVGPSVQDIWVPAAIVKWDDYGVDSPKNEIVIRLLAGPSVGSILQVQSVEPYTAETSQALRDQGFHVMRPDGVLDIPIIDVDGYLGMR